jgi:hypothetical protein
LTVVLDEKLVPVLERVTAILSDYDPVTQQKVLELATVRHIMPVWRTCFFRGGLNAQARAAADRTV